MVIRVSPNSFISVYPTFIFFDSIYNVGGMLKEKVVFMKKRTDLRVIIIKDFIELLKDSEW